jgi:ASC-1-like (ASCH) protein
MTTYEMRLHPGPFSRIQSGTQVIESRIHDEKRQQMKVGDRILFKLRPEEVEIQEVEVTDFLYAKTFAELFAMQPLVDFGRTPETDPNDMYEYYTKEDEQEFGVVGIKFKKVV